MSSTVVRNLQLALWDEDFALLPGDRQFIDEWIANGGNGSDAMRKARQDLTKNSAKKRAIRKLDPADPANAEILRYLAWKQAQLVMRANLTEDELIGMGRRNWRHSVGDMKLRKSLVSRDEEGQITVEDVEVYDPSLSAANTAVEFLRKLGGFGVERSEVKLDGEMAIAGLSEAEREARLAELASKAGLAPTGAPT